MHFASLGADVVVNFFRNRAPAEETAAEIRALGRRALVVKANIGELDELEDLFSAVEAEFGGLDFLVHNAASGYNRPVLEQKARGWDWTMNINARALLFAAQRAAAADEKTGRGRDRQHLQPRRQPGAAGLCGGGGQQSRPGGHHPLPGSGAGLREHRRQRCIARRGTDRCLEAFRWAVGPAGDHRAGNRPHASWKAGDAARRGGFGGLPVLAGREYDPRAGDHDRWRRHLAGTRGHPRN